MGMKRKMFTLKVDWIGSHDISAKHLFSFKEFHILCFYNSYIIEMIL